MADALELARAVDVASRVFFSALNGPTMAALNAKHYLSSRRVFPPAVDAFRIGFSLREAGWLQRKLPEFSTKTLLEAGLLVEGKNGLVDPMQGRIIFPQASPQGTIVGFVGRAIDPEVPEAYKYVSTPLSPIFRRTELLYRMDMAQRSIEAEGKAILVEGPLDAVLLWQIGKRNVVALGTKRMTDAQAQVLARYAGRLEVMFDTGAEEDKSFDRLRHSHGHYFTEVERVRVPQGYEDPANWVTKTIDSRLTG